MRHDEHPCIEVYVSRKVQGVYFRAFTRDTALKIGLCGYVENLPDGRVRAIAAGSRSDLLTFLDRLRVGPQNSHVDNVEFQWSDRDEDLSGFSIRR